jgi:signal transduction histidine kinase
MWLDDLKEGLAQEKLFFDYFRCINGIEKELVRAETTIKRFLKMESIIKTEKNVTDVNLLIQQALKEIPSVLDFFSDIDFIPIKSNIFVKIDLDDIIHAIKEILVNAMKYGDENTVLKIRIKTNSRENIQICIINYGYGINKGDQKKIFNPMSGYKNKGFGLGLLLAKDLIESDGGKIHLGAQCNERTKDEIGKAEFIIELPIYKMEQIND